jgi:SagB-type dehydrogenase family enzyme
MTTIMKRVLSFLCFFILLNGLHAQELKTLTLNHPDKTRGLTVMQALENRASAEKFSSKKLSLHDLSDLLWAANGINRPELKKRTAPSALNAQDIDIYVFMEEGVYIFEASGNVLNPVIKGDNRMLMAGKQTDIASCPVILLLVSDISRFSSGDNASKLTWAAMDAGIVSQNISVFCASIGLSTRPRVSMDQKKLKAILSLKDSQYPLLNNPVSYPVE